MKQITFVLPLVKTGTEREKENAFRALLVAAEHGRCYLK